MVSKVHNYETKLEWTGNLGKGTQSYASYKRSYDIKIEGKPVLEGSSDPAFRGDPTKYNPEELFLASLSSCHMLWYLHLCSEAGITIVSYTDNAIGEMTEKANGSGAFSKVVLSPEVQILEVEMLKKAEALHKTANEMCFIANSCNFDVLHEPTTVLNE